MEFLVIKGLDSETNAIHPQTEQMPHKTFGHVIGISLYGHLGQRRKSKVGEKDFY
jgi:hypothetical protein